MLLDTLRFDDEEVMDLWSIFLFFVICFLLMSCCGYCCTKKRRGAVLSDTDAHMERQLLKRR
uniref:Uncharacterized protein n=1 Tax=Glossina morsitans morsitans TaxID=37546 RepID=A0A1B0FJM1_GLOMM